MVDMGRASINSMNYFFLRSVFKDDYPQHIKEELSNWLDYVTKGIDRCGEDDADLIDALYDYAYQEINEGEYCDDIETVPDLIEEYCKENTDLDNHQIITLCDFYDEICQGIIAKNHLEERG